MENIESFNKLKQRIADSKKSLVLLYKSNSEQSLCALDNLGKANKDNKSVPVFVADVTNVKDIHEQYGVNSVPSLLLFENNNLLGVVKGCHDAEYYKAVLTSGPLGIKQSTDNEVPSKRVVVYSTPTCSWCNTLKTWLNKNNIKYKDIDVSADQHAAAELVKRSGQQGVPQTDIDGKIIVGFDQQRLKDLLGIR